MTTPPTLYVCQSVDYKFNWTEGIQIQYWDREDDDDNDDDDIDEDRGHVGRMNEDQYTL